MKTRNITLTALVPAVLLLAAGCSKEASVSSPAETASPTATAAAAARPASVTAALAEMARQAETETPPRLLEAGRQGVEELLASGLIDSALNVGDTMPAFTLNDAFGAPVSSDALLEKSHLIVVFYRGAWCPFCNLYLHGMQARLADFQAHGANLVAISVEPADRSAAVAQKNELNYAVLSDPQLEVARTFGIVYEMPAVTNAAILEVGFDIAKYNGMEKTELPLSATYVVRRDGEIAYAFLDPDYKKRADPDDIIAVLDTL